MSSFIMHYFMPSRSQETSPEGDVELYGRFHSCFAMYGLKHSAKCLKNNPLYRNNPQLYTEYKKNLRRQMAGQYARVIIGAPWLVIRGLFPSFVKGSNNLWTNISAILFRPEFRPLRGAVVSWGFILVTLYLVVRVY